MPKSSSAQTRGDCAQPDFSWWIDAMASTVRTMAARGLPRSAQAGFPERRFHSKLPSQERVVSRCRKRYVAMQTSK